MRLLLAEDEDELGKLVRDLFRDVGFVVDLAPDLSWAKEAVQQSEYDLVVLDRRLPDGDGLELVSFSKRKRVETRFLLLSALGDVEDREVWQKHADEAVRVATVNLRSKPAPAGNMTIVLEAGWPGVMVHEAVGHGLEGDAVYRGQSVYAGQIGEQVAAKGVTIIDDGTIHEARGSLNMDDEGTPSRQNVLIEDGILKGYLHDRRSARLMGHEPTGNGRRQSYAHTVLPRMTNTYMASGQYESEEIVASVEDGLLAVSLGGGQVNPTSGDFVFQCTEAYKIRDGKIEEPVTGATIVGNGPIAMKNAVMVGNATSLDPGVGVCGKKGQSVPVGVGQPMVRLDNMTVGGTA
nr:metallopeptidase TldD-related protein [Hyphomonas sp. Mor2]